ncbi:MAG: hypothetical protein JWO47_173 [Candidatus Saccharibacteria bacterium]|nr:hypothetical protein [Candidatus Saccharibacteria bacterium]
MSHKESFMTVRRLEITNTDAELSIGYAGELSTAARMFGAGSHHEARRHPGTYDRPVVGHDPDYYVRKAGQVLSGAVKADPELENLYRHAWSLSSQVAEATLGPRYGLGGPSVGSAVKLVEVTSAIQESLAAKDLKITLDGKWLERAVDICDFAVRVIEVSPTRLLYQGIARETPTNTLEYWLGVTDQLITPVPQAAPLSQSLVDVVAKFNVNVVG